MGAVLFERRLFSDSFVLVSKVCGCPNTLLRVGAIDDMGDEGRKDASCYVASLLGSRV